MAGWKGIVGEAFSAKNFDAYCHTLQWTAWRPSFIALHNTAAPSLAQRPNGLTKQHIKKISKRSIVTSKSGRPALTSSSTTTRSGCSRR